MFVCPSVRPSRTQRIIREPKGLACPNLEGRFTIIDATHTSFKVERSKIKVNRPINADTHCAPYLPNGKAYELQTWYKDGRRRPASATAPRPSRSKLKVARSRDPSEPSWPNAVPVSLDAGGGIPCWPNHAATLVVVVVVVVVAAAAAVVVVHHFSDGIRRYQ